MDPARYKFYLDNVKNTELLNEFPSDCNLPHTDKNSKPLAVGDDVVCGCNVCGDSGERGRCKCNTRNRSWTVGKCGIVLKLGVISRAKEAKGHLLQMDDGITVVSIDCILLLNLV